MSANVVLLELEPATEVVDPDVGDIDIGARVRAVHAAGAGPGAPTRCGLVADELEPEDYTPEGPDAPWYPPEYRSRRCLDCDAALRSG